MACWTPATSSTLWKGSSSRSRKGYPAGWERAGGCQVDGRVQIREGVVPVELGGVVAEHDEAAEPGRQDDRDDEQPVAAEGAEGAGCAEGAGPVAWIVPLGGRGRGPDPSG
ncbi:hypothetical protein GCM10018952_54880 [Streptosporangium vulgare]